MAAYFFSNNFDRFSSDWGPCNGDFLSVSQSLVFDNEKGELVKTAQVKVGEKSVSEEKVAAALKSHREAERGRRERINAHLDTLRSLLPCREKMDKATLLGEVIRQVKELKKSATEASKGFVVPMDDDEVRVESCDNDDDDATGKFSFKASICCDYRPELLTDLREALDALPMKAVKAEISTLGNRLKNDFVFTSSSRGRTAYVDDAEVQQFLASSIHQALNSVLEKASTSPGYSPCSTFTNKRRRVSYFGSSSSLFLKD